MTKAKLKNFFAPEPKCKVLGSGKKCVTGNLPSYKKAEYVFNKLAGLKLPKKLYGKLMTELGGMKPLRDKFGPTLGAAIQDEKMLRVLKSMPRKTSDEIKNIMKVTNRQNKTIKRMFKEQNMMN